MAKIGFCCKWIDDAPLDPKSSKAYTARMNQKTTTQKYLRSLSKTDQFKKIFELVDHNCQTLWRQLRWIALQPEGTRMFRITSEFLPLYTVKEFAWIYAHYSIEELIIDHLRTIRKFADGNKIRLTMHPGQFTNLCSTRKDVVEASIEDFEYHAMLARIMGYGDTWHSSGFAINIHANSNQDPGLKQIRRIISNDLSDTARNLITLENDEYSCSVKDFLDAGVHEDVALVLDLHHHWINSKGEYLPAWSMDAVLFRDSWRTERPLGHISMPQQSLVPITPTYLVDSPDYKALVALKGVNSAKLRAHSWDMWNTGLLARYTSHATVMDIEVEAKGKNLASHEFYQAARLLGYI